MAEPHAKKGKRTEVVILSSDEEDCAVTSAPRAPPPPPASASPPPSSSSTSTSSTLLRRGSSSQPNPSRDAAAAAAIARAAAAAGGTSTSSSSTTATSSSSSSSSSTSISSSSLPARSETEKRPSPPPDPSRPVCKYGDACYRIENPVHQVEYSHPGDYDYPPQLVEDLPLPRQGSSEKRPSTLHASPSASSTTTPSSSSSSTSPYAAIPPEDILFKLTRVDVLGARYNDHMAVSMREILDIPGCRIVSSAQFNYTFDTAWLMEQYPAYARSKPLIVVHGNSTHEGKAALREGVAEYPNVRFFAAPNLDQWGTHHTKMMLLFYETSMRVVVMTANAIPRDWALKTQGVWISPLFPRTDPGAERVPSATAPHPSAQPGLATDLWEYLLAYGNGVQEGASIAMIRDRVAAHDLTGAAHVRLVASVPGMHRGNALHRWGILKLRRLLETHVAPAPKGPAPGLAPVFSAASSAAAAAASSSSSSSSPLSSRGARDEIVLQFSSIGSLGGNARTPGGFIDGTLLPCMAGRRGPGGDAVAMHFVYPAVEDVRMSFEGYAAGGCLPHSAKYADAHNKVLRPDTHRWRAEWCGRTHASPHIKTFMRWTPATRTVAWAVLTSHNLSKAAWGQVQKDGTQLAIRSYELGVVFLPRPPGADGTPATRLRLLQDWKGEGGGGGDAGDGVRTQWLPIPYDLPLTAYRSSDELWFWDKPYSVPDRHGVKIAP